MSDIVDTIDGALRDFETSLDAMRWTAEPPIAPPRATLPDVPQVVVTITPIVEQFQRAMRQLAEVIVRVDWDTIRRALSALEPPRNGPKPLPIDGHAYRRRSRRRRR